MAESCGPRCPECGLPCSLEEQNHRLFTHADKKPFWHGHACPAKALNGRIWQYRIWPLSEEEQTMRALARLGR